MRASTIILLLVGSCLLYGQTNKEPDKQPQAPASTASEHQSETKGPHDWIDSINASSTFVIAVFTVLMFFVVRLQVREYRARERAWVVFSLLDEPIKPEKGGVSIIGVVHNVGSTPAIVTRMTVFGKYLQTDRDDKFDEVPVYLQQKESASTTFQMIPGDSIPASLFVDTDHFNEAQNGQVDIYVFGQILYKDVFGKCRETRYCFRYYGVETPTKQGGFYPEGPPEYTKVT